MQIIHSAGKPIGLIQRCSRCGVVLQDYTNALSVGDWRPSWWDGNVFIDGRFSGATEEAANCEAVEQKNAVDGATTCPICGMLFYQSWCPNCEG